MSIKVEITCWECGDHHGPGARHYCQDCYESQETNVRLLRRRVRELEVKLDRAEARLEKARRKK